MKYTLIFLWMMACFSGLSQNGLNFNATDNLVQTTFPGILGHNEITVEAWIKPGGANNEQIITAWGTDAVHGGRFTFRVNAVGATDVIRIENKGGGINGTIDINDGAWHHVAVTYDPNASTKYSLYVDGVLDIAANITQPLNIIADVDMRLGRRIHATYTGWFDGPMDEVRVWNVARSAAEINATMNVEFC